MRPILFSSWLSCKIPVKEKVSASIVYLSHLILRNFRNYRRLELAFPQGPIVFSGGNAQGKSNLLEAVYCLVLTKSPRAESDREMINLQALKEGDFTEISATVQRRDGPLKAHLNLFCALTQPGGPKELGPTLSPIQKRIRINGLTHPASEAVGQVTAVLFSADDIQIVLGPPSARRRFLDILLSQIDNAYLRSLQKYQRILLQRNHLLRSMREKRAKEEELHFWDKEMCREGAFILQERSKVVASLAQTASQIYADLTDSSESLGIGYKSTIRQDEGQTAALETIFQHKLTASRSKEVDAGITLIGPHRDDLLLAINGMDMGLFSSRGQARTAALALRLAEAKVLAERRGDEPILLLDDVLSELDSIRRRQVIQAAIKAQQAFITTLDTENLERLISPSASFLVNAGTIIPKGRDS